MSDEEIIAARTGYENEVWRSFGRTVLAMPDMTAARLAHNERCAVLLQELPPEVVATLRPWQGGPEPKRY